MEKIKFKVEYKDPEYSRALEKAIILRFDQFVLSQTDQNVIINELICPPYEPVQNIIAKTMAKMNRPNGPAKPLKNIIFTAFTAAIGGGGLSTTALTYARIAARIFNRKIAFLSYDPWFRNNFPKEDEYGIVYLESFPKSINVDEIVFDLPYGIENYRDKLDICERRIVVLGLDENRVQAGKDLYEELVESASTYIEVPKTFIFANHKEENLDINDIHKELGKEVLELARKLEEE